MYEWGVAMVCMLHVSRYLKKSVHLYEASVGSLLDHASFLQGLVPLRIDQRASSRRAIPTPKSTAGRYWGALGCHRIFSEGTRLDDMVILKYSKWLKGAASWLNMY